MKKIMQLSIVFIFIGLLVVGLISYVYAQETETQNPDKKLSPEEISYLGAFRLPADGDIEEEMFSWGGEAITYSENNDTLFITGHNWFAYVGEISIPAPIISDNIDDLPVAEIVQPLSDIRNNLFDRWYLEILRVGLEVLDNQLFFCWGTHLQDIPNLGTHGVTSLDLSTPNADKVSLIGDHNYSTNDYIFKIPNDWRAAYFPKYDLVTGRFRDGGWSGMGPSLFAFSSENLIKADMDEKIEAIPLIFYDTSYEGNEGEKMADYSHADSWTGGAWISSPEGVAVLFAGTHGWGETWYGFSNGIVFPIETDENTVYPEVPDWPHDARGWWNDDFRATIIMYDPNDFVSVQNKTLDANAVQPYALIDLSEFLLVDHDETTMQYLGGVAYDLQNQRIFILELFADEDKPIIHVFGVGETSGIRIESSSDINILEDQSQTEETQSDVENVTPTNETIKNLIFIHHSCGANLLSNGLNTTLNENGFHVADISYGWDQYGDNTDTGDWENWFTDEVMQLVYNEKNTIDAYNTLSSANGENEIILFKSCFPNSDVGRSNKDEKELYNNLISYYEDNPDKMFVLLTSPPLINISHAEVTRDLTNWLVDRENGWLKNLSTNNVFVFDFYNVLTHPDAHHYFDGSNEIYKVIDGFDELYYDSSGDDHPNDIGNKKSSEELISLLLYWYQIFKQ